MVMVVNGDGGVAIGDGDDDWQLISVDDNDDGGGGDNEDNDDKDDYSDSESGDGQQLLHWEPSPQ